MEQIEDHIPSRRDEVHVPGRTVAISWNRAAGIREERCREANVLHVGERRLANIIFRWIAGAVVEHGHAVAHQFHVAQLFGGDCSDEAVKQV